MRAKRLFVLVRYQIVVASVITVVVCLTELPYITVFWRQLSLSCCKLQNSTDWTKSNCKLILGSRIFEVLAKNINYSESVERSVGLKKAKLGEMFQEIESLATKGVWTKRGLGHGLPCGLGHGLPYGLPYGLPVVDF